MIFFSTKILIVLKGPKASLNWILVKIPSLNLEPFFNSKAAERNIFNSDWHDTETKFNKNACMSPNYPLKIKNLIKEFSHHILRSLNTKLNSSLSLVWTYFLSINNIPNFKFLKEKSLFRGNLWKPLWW